MTQDKNKEVINLLPLLKTDNLHLVTDVFPSLPDDISAAYVEFRKAWNSHASACKDMITYLSTNLASDAVFPPEALDKLKNMFETKEAAKKAGVDFFVAAGKLESDVTLALVKSFHMEVINMLKLHTERSVMEVYEKLRSYISSNKPPAEEAPIEEKQESKP